MNAQSKRALLAASLAGLVVASGAAAFGTDAQAADGEKVPCYGINKCKGTGDCGGKGHGCAGKNECAGAGYISLDKETCLKIKDGRLTPETTG